MDRVNGAGTIDIGSGRRGFIDEDLAVGREGTEVTALWLNMLQEEILKVSEASGFVANAGAWDQLAKAIQSQRLNYAVAAGTANALVAELPIAPSNYATIRGATIRLLLAATNTDAVTLNLNGLGVLPVVFNNGSALRPGDLPIGVIELVVEDGRFTIAGFSPAFVGSALATEGGRILNFKIWRETARQALTGTLNPGIVLFSTSYTKQKASSRLVFEALPSLRLAATASSSYARARLDGNAATDLLQNHYLITNNGGENYQQPQMNRFIWDGIDAGPHTLEYRIGQQQTSTTTIVKNPTTSDGAGWVSGYVSTWVMYEVENN